MEDIFIKLLNMSITASYMVLVLFLIRVLFRKAPKWLLSLLWGLVGVRLVLPFSFESILSIIPSTNTIPDDIVTQQSPHIDSGIPSLNSTVNPVLEEAFTPEIHESANPLQIVIFIASLIWITGLAVMLIYAFASFIAVKKKTAVSVEDEKSVFLCDTIDTPFILGIIKPAIYIPSFISGEDKRLILAHERAHLKRKDHLWKPLGFILLSVYWFNPLLWAAYVLLCRDIEGACDEKVIKALGEDIKKPYSQALISCSVSRRSISVCPLAFGETDVKARIQNILKYKKPAIMIIVLSVILCITVSVCLLTDPKDKSSDILPDSVTVHTDLDGVYLSLESIEQKDDETRIFHCIWHNETDANVKFGEMYDIEIKEGNEWKSVKKRDIVFHLIAYLLMPGSSQEKSYSSEFFDLSEKGTYRLICGFSSEGQDELFTYIEFNTDNIQSSSDVTNLSENAIIRRTMTIDDVIELSKKGNALTWEDFEEFTYVEPTTSLATKTQSRIYKIDERFHLFVEGTPDEKPAQILLNTPLASAGRSFDIRNDGIEEFIRENENNPIIKELSWGYYISTVDNDGGNFDKMIRLGGFTEYMHLSSIKSPPVLTVTSTEELNSFTKAMSDTMDFSIQSSDKPSFNSVIKYFDGEFFKESDLILIYISSPSPSYTYTLKRIYTSDDSLYIEVTEEENGEEELQNNGQLMAICITKDGVKHTNKIYARITVSD